MLSLEDAEELLVLWDEPAVPLELLAEEAVLSLLEVL